MKQGGSPSIDSREGSLLTMAQYCWYVWAIMHAQAHVYVNNSRTIKTVS